MSDLEQPNGVSRRTVTKAMAWAVPAAAVAAAVPAPAFAASPPCVLVTLGGNACKWPGSGNNWSYNLEFCYQNNCGKEVTVKITKLQNNAQKPFTPCSGNSHIGLEVTLGAGTQICVGPYPYASTSSANYVEVYGQIKPAGGQYGPEVLLASIPTSEFKADCTGTSPCAA